MYGAVIVNGTPLQLVMELMQGSIRDLIDAAHASSCYLSYREQIDIATGTIAGIVYMHQLQPNPYVHCDIRSTNVMVTRDMVAKVGDLGASHIINSSLSVGPLSREYVAPERIPGPNGMSTPSTCQSDIYSLGIYLIELFNGILPSPAEKNSQLQQIHDDALVDLCTQMTEKDPSHRPTAHHCFCLLERQTKTTEYKMSFGRRLVKGHLDGQKEMTLIDYVYQ
jgi:serine/threonine protein kinase